MGEVEVDQRLRDLQREYLDFLDDEVLQLMLLFCKEIHCIMIVIQLVNCDTTLLQESSGC
jgi:hypothetical protein